MFCFFILQKDPMKTLLSVLILTFLFSCSTKEKAPPAAYPTAYEAEPEWVYFEGYYPDGRGGRMTMELSLKSGGVGVESQYKFSERDYECNCTYHGGNAAGSYSTMYGANPSETVIELRGKGFLYYVTAGDETTKSNREIFMTDRTASDIEMFFRSDGNDRLVALDKNLRPLSEDEEYTLHRRSKPFTVEGYLTFTSDSAEFFEMNVNETWVVAKLGSYKSAKFKYLQLVKEKFEGLYVKALAYSVHHVNAKGEDIDALVLRQIFEIRPGKGVD
jgi:hypothetical protein